MKQQPKDGNIVHQCWTAALIDLSDQKELLKKIDFLCPDWKPEHFLNYKQNFDNTYGRLKYIKDKIHEMHEIFSQRRPIAQYNEQQMRTWKKMGSPEIKIERFSDSLLVYFPMNDYDNYSIPNGINDILVLSGILMLAALAKEIPLRIGIAIGAGALIDGLLYGPVVASAHELESKIAQFPRAVISNKIKDLLRGEASTPLPGITNECGPIIKKRYDQNIAECCLDYIEEDDSGNWFVDYLSPKFIEAVSITRKTREVLNTMIPSARDFVNAEFNRFCERNELEIHELYNKKLTLQEQYEHLKKYFDDYVIRSKKMI